MADLLRAPERDGESGFLAYSVVGRIRLDQLDQEMREEFGWSNPDLVYESPSTGEATEATPGYLWIGVDGADTNRVKALVKAHEPQEEFTPSSDFPGITFRAVALKAAEGGILTEEEIQVALRGLLAIADL